MNPYTEAMTRILKEVVERREFFEKHPKALAYWMHWYNELHYASRFDPDERLHDWDNLKYAVMDLQETVGEEYANFVYDAWASVPASLERKRDGKPHKLESKINKTCDDWVAMSLDKKYRYNCLFPDRLSVLNQLLCVIGNGLGWNKDGYICDEGPSGLDETIFFEYDTKGKRQLPDDLKRLIRGWRMHKVMFHGFKRMKAAARKSAAEEAKARRALKSLEKLLKKKDRKKVAALIPQRETLYPLSENYSLLATMPENAHPSYISAGKEISELILANPKEPKESFKVAKRFLERF